MPKVNLDYLNFATDLRRVAYCLLNNDKKNAQSFINHASQIYIAKFTHYIDETLSLSNNLLQSIKFDSNLPKQKKKIADKLITFSSIIFSQID